MIPGSMMRRLGLGVLASAFLVFVSAAPAPAAAPWWQLSGEATPSNLPPEGQGQVIVVASNLGDEPINGGAEHVTITDKLPAGLVATGAETRVVNGVPVNCSTATIVTCTFAGILNPYERIAVPIDVNVTEPKGTVASLSQEASVQGGGAAGTSANLAVKVSGQPTEFGVSSYELTPFGEDGSPARQAGSHPFQLTTTLALNQESSGSFRQPVALPRDLSFRLPAGLIGNPTAVAQCSMTDFVSIVDETNLCPVGSVVGVATVTADEPKNFHVFSKTVPVFNLVPSQGEPARFGFEVLGVVPIVIDTAVRTGKGYEVVASVKGATETAGLLSSQVTLWGVPGDPRHDNARGWECVAGGAFARQAERPCPTTDELPRKPFLTLPTACEADPQAEPVVSTTEADSWARPGSFLSAEYAWMSQAGQPLGFEECNELSFDPEIDVTPEQHTASTPTGLAVDVSVRQEGLLEAEGRAQADVRDTTVTLPQGVQLSPSAANGLAACPESPEDGYEGIGFTGFQKLNGAGLEAGAETATFTPTFRFEEEGKLPPSCPEASKLGSVHIRTPLLSHELEGSVYLASPAPNGEAGRNPFNSLVALYIVAQDPESGVLVKLAGEGHIDEGTLQISTTFKNAPQVPFEELRLDLFGGPRASVSTPSLCGTYPTSAVFTPWSGTGLVSVPSPAEAFAISSGAGGSGCPSGGLAFAPGFNAYSQNTQAGAFTGFTLELSRPDGDQALSTVSMHLPGGIAALLSSVELCSEAQAATSTCPAGSEIGQAIAIAGLGPEPYVQEGGRVYITGPYGDAPFGLEIVTLAKAGPFDLGYVTVRSKLYIDPHNASVTIVSDPLPTQVRGIPLQLKRVIVNVDKPGFEFNPTSCAQMTIEGTITGAEHGSANVSSPFKAENCAALQFSPQLTASAVGHGSKADGTTFKVIVTSGGTNSSGVAQAGIAKVELQLPKQLSSRLPTLQKACTEATFNSNPASCDEGSVIGYATIHTPVLRNPLSGPAYLVSHGGAAFPDVEFVLQGEDITLVLDGKTDIKRELTYSRFESTPDAPFTVFETVLPAGPHGVLTPNVAESKKFDLCGESLAMPTTIVAQNGVVLEQATKVTIEGCGAVKSAKARKLTLLQQLNRALVSCRHSYKHSQSRRERCERQAHTRYTRLALASCRHEHKHAGRERLACEQMARRRFVAKQTARGKGS